MRAPSAWSARTRLATAMVAVALVSTTAALLGISVRSTVAANAAVDEPQYLLSAISLWDDADLDISDELAARAYLPFHDDPLPVQTETRADGAQLSPHDLALPALLAVPVGLGGWIAAKVTLAVLAGVLAALTTWMGVVRFGTRTGLTALVVGTAGVTAPLAVYGQQIYPELPAALAVVGAAAILTARPERIGPAGLMGLIGCIVVLPWLSIKYVVVATVIAVIGLARLWRVRRGSTMGWVAGALVASGVGYLVIHQLVYGGWTAYAAGDHFQASGEFGVVGLAPDYLGRSTRLIGLFADRDFGLLAWAPAWLLVVPAVAALVRVRPRNWVVLAVPLGIGWLVATFVALTMHGFWWPGRQVVVVLPLAVLAVAWWLGTLAGRARRVVLTAAGLLGVASVTLYVRLVVGGWAGELQWVNAPDWTGGPVLTALRSLLPDYRADGATTWMLHAVWVAALVALAVAGYRTAPPAGALPEPTPENRTESMEEPECVPT